MVVRGGRGRDGVAVSNDLAAAYSATVGAWSAGPGRIYDRLAEVLVAASPVRLAGARVIDAGAGAGAAGRAALAAGASAVVAVDVAVGMLAGPAGRTTPVAGDLVALPFTAGAFDAAVAAFSLNHLPDPAAGLREMARVTRRGGAVLATSYALDDAHPVKAAVEGALAARGWRPDPWYVAVRDRATAALATEAHGRAAAAAAGLDAAVEVVHEDFADLDAHDLVEWRLGLAQHAPFVAGLSPPARAAVAADARRRMGEAVPCLVRSVLVLRALSP